MFRGKTKKNRCKACSNIIDMISDLNMLGRFLDDMLEDGKEDLTPKERQARSKVQEGIKSVLNETVHKDVESVPCRCTGQLHKKDIKGRFPNQKVADISCRCPDMITKKEILSNLKKNIREKIHSVYTLDMDLQSKKPSAERKESAAASNITVDGDQDIPLPYKILKNKAEFIKKKNLLIKIDILNKLYSSRLRRLETKEIDINTSMMECANTLFRMIGLLDCDEDTIRGEIGQHRIIPKEINTNFILERAFKNRGSLEEELYQGFVKSTQERSPWSNILSERVPRSPESHGQSLKTEEPTLISEDFSSAKDSLQIVFPDHIPDPKTATCDCQRVSFKICRLEYIKDLLYQVLESKDMDMQKSIMECASNLLRLITQEQIEENERNKSKKRQPSDSHLSNSSSGSNSSRKETRLQGSPSFERFRRRILHEMRVERRPLSWFQKRCSYFRRRNQRSTNEPKYSKTSYEKREEKRQKRIKKATGEAIDELLELHKAKPYKKLENPDEYTLKKLTMIAKKLIDAENTREDADKENSKEKTIEWPYGKMLQRTNELYENLQETRECANLIQSSCKSDEDSDSDKELGSDCSCRELRNKLLEHSNTVNEVRSLFLDAIFFMETEDRASNEAEVKPKSEERTKLEFRGIDLNELKIDFKEHIARGKNYESFTQNFEEVWQNSVINGLFSFNSEIQLMEQERIIIHPMREKGVKIMSGGRVGLEPLYSEYIAKGMLDCVVLGDKYSGPSVRNILQAMVEIATDDGILIIIMNEHDYRLNFLLAIQQAQGLGIKADIVLARDDASDEKYEERETGRRGSVGIILQYKVAGAMAEEGYSLQTISRVCQFMFIASLSCYMDSTHVYIGTGFELGTGRPLLEINSSHPKINIEDETPDKLLSDDRRFPYIGDNSSPEKVDTESNTASEEPTQEEFSILYIAKEMLCMLLDDNSPHYIAPEPGTEVILLLNNQGYSYDQMYAIAREVTTSLDEIDVKVGRLYINNFIALPQDGFSITIAKDWERNLIPLLDKPTTCYLWSPHSSGGAFCSQALTRKVPDLSLGAQVHPEYQEVVNQIFEQFLQEMKIYRKTINASEPIISNQINEIIMSIRPKYIFNKIAIDRPYQLLLNIATDFEALDGYGLLLCLFLTTAAQEFKVSPKTFVTWRMCCNAFYRGASSLAGYLRHENGDGSIADVLLPLAKACFETKRGLNPLSSFKYALDKLDEAKWIDKDDPGMLFCMMIMSSIYEILDKCFGNLDQTAWEEEEDKVHVVVSENKANRRYVFATEEIDPETKEILQKLEYSSKLQ